MAARPKSGITADTDVNLDFLTKEEKEALLSKKMDMIRQRNKALTERHKLIEADKKKAEEAGQAVKPAIDSQTLPAEGAPKPRGRGRGQNHHRDANRPGKDRPKSQGDIRDSSHYEPIVDTTDLANYRGRGRGGPQERDAPHNTPKNRRKPPSKEEAATYPANFEYEPIVDMKDLDKRFGPFLNAADVTDHGNHSSQQRHSNRRHDDGRHESGVAFKGYPRNDRNRNRNTAHDDNDQPSKEKAYSGRLKDTEGPPPDPSFNPLADRRRADKKEEQLDHRRHPRNYGGGADLTKVKQNMKTMREKEKERPTSNKPLELIMTGKERKNHEEWKAERERYDKERIQRQMNDAGSWKRAWDADKVNQDTDDSYHSARVEPAKRPAGRIGSGRFDRGDREERPRSAIIGKGGLQPQDHPPQRQHPHQDQRPLSPGTGGDKAPKGRGRGRGRGRAKAMAPGEKSPRPRTWSGGDDRFVECQKELLLVKFDNTAGDNSVEVEYDDVDLPASPQSTPKSPALTTTPGRGPTGRTPNQGNKQQSRGNKQKSRGPRHKGKQSTNAQGAVEESWETPSSQALIDTSGDALAGFSGEESRVRTSSHSQSYGDSEEWEDCTESSGVPEDDDIHGDVNNTDLHLTCKLNPEAPEFLPTSPDFLKTPPGHVKVLNWASEHSPTSPLSQGSQTTPPQLSQGHSPRAPPTPQSSTSSPGSSVSTKAMKMREEMDTMPEGDHPHPPPFLLPADTDSQAPSASKMPMKEDSEVTKEEEDEEEEEKFEDSVDDTHHDDIKETMPQESSQNVQKRPSEEFTGGRSPVEEREKSATPLTESADVADLPEDAVLLSKADDLPSDSLAAELLQASKISTENPVLDLASELAQAGETAGSLVKLSGQPDSIESPGESTNEKKKGEGITNGQKREDENVEDTNIQTSAEAPEQGSVVQDGKGSETSESSEGDPKVQTVPECGEVSSETQNSKGTEISGNLKEDSQRTEDQDNLASESTETQDSSSLEKSALPTAADSVS